MSEDWISHVWPFPGCALVFGRNKEGNDFKLFLEGDAAKQIEALERTQFEEMQRLLMRLTNEARVAA